MTQTAVAWPPALIGTPAVVVIEQAIARQRLSHSLLLHGDDHDTLVAIAHAIADRLLNPPGAKARFPVEQHPDFLTLRPKGKMRIIPIGKAQSPEPGTMREFLPKLYMTGAVAAQKVAVIHEADRMNVETSNAFLKTLEEPPRNTTLLLLTTHPYALLPTIRSRVLHFRFPSVATAALVLASAAAAEAWKNWLDDYRAWLGRVAGTTTGKQAVAGHIFTLYGLVARFSAVLDAATGEVWQQQKAKLPSDLEEDEQVAIETGIANGLRARLFAEIEQATRQYALSALVSEQPAPARRAVTAAIDKLEHNAGLLRLNLSEAAALEDFLLTSLRLWSKR